jgi:hypothetical protein
MILVLFDFSSIEQTPPSSMVVTGQFRAYRVVWRANFLNCSRTERARACKNSEGLCPLVLSRLLQHNKK